MDALVNEFPVIIEIPILWGQMDSFQHLNNVMYFRFFESARIAYFQKIGFLDYMDETGIGPILASTNCKYLKPITFPDTIFVGAKVTEMKDDRFLMKYALKSEQADDLAAIGEAKVVCYNYNQNTTSELPKKIKQYIIDLEGDLD
ncbi:MAG: Acyl-CoA thioester hydrolase [Promethearchaeota archaeon]|jgi:acyl-CoA thioester hydrolase|nr:MAG: Acyl-CoA thioester hydrolase [Candidatus Lokiarchaeota archaeon]